MDLIGKNNKRELRKFLDNNKFNKILVITGKNSFYKSGASNIFENLFKNKRVSFFFKKSSFPNISELKEIIMKCVTFRPDIIIAVGGGSVLDYAKMANVLRTSKNLDQEIKNSCCKFTEKFSKLLAIPTTAGTGAEVTANSTIYIKKIKYSVEHEFLKPDYFFIIPELIIKASKKIKASAGFDAISQSLESLISIRSNLKSVIFAKKSLKLSFKYFLEYISKPTIENTFQMGLAANYSGKAISISKTTAPHALSYPFTAYFNISHGHAVSLTLNQFMKFNFLNQISSKSSFDLKKRFNSIFKVAGVKNINEFDKYLTNLQQKSGLEKNLKKLGIEIQKDYPKILSGVNSQRLSNNPIKIQKTDIRKILLEI